MYISIIIHGEREREREDWEKNRDQDQDDLTSEKGRVSGSYNNGMLYSMCTKALEPKKMLCFISFLFKMMRHYLNDPVDLQI